MWGCSTHLPQSSLAVLIPILFRVELRYRSTMDCLGTNVYRAGMGILGVLGVLVGLDITWIFACTDCVKGVKGGH